MKHFAGIALLLLTGCLKIEDFGTSWDKGAVDPQLTGEWSHTGTGTTYQKITFTQDGSELRYRFKAISPELDKKSYVGNLSCYVRSLKSGDQTYLMYCVLEKNSGWLQRYKIENGRLHLFILDDRVVEKSIKAGELSGTIPKRSKYDSSKASVPNPLTAFETCAASHLDDKTLKFLDSEASKSNHWTEITYDKIDNLGKKSNEHRDSSLRSE